MADLFLDRKPMKLPKNGSNVICFFAMVLTCLCVPDPARCQEVFPGTALLGAYQH